MNWQALLLAIVVLAVAGCVDRDVPYDTGKRSYQGKPDGKPWDNPPLAYEHAKWAPGNRASWEDQLKKRQRGQDEDNRINE